MLSVNVFRTSIASVLAVAALNAGSAFAAPAAGSAADIIVNGCDGVLRAAKSVEKNSFSKVVASVAQGSGSISLASGEMSISADIYEGKATFDRVAPGTWELCPQTEVSEVRILSNTTSSGATAAIIGATGLLAGGAAIAFSDSSGGDSDPARAVVPPSVQVDPNEITIGAGDGYTASDNSGTGTKDEGGNKRPTCAAIEDCLNDESPAPISPIS